MNPKHRFTLRHIAVFLFLFTFSTSYAAVIYVDADVAAGHDGQSWTTAFNKLQDALTAAGSGDEIHVAQGTYRPDESLADPNGTDDRGAVFALADGLTLLGGYPGFDAPDPNARHVSDYKTVLSGDLDENDTEVTNASNLLGNPNRAENSYHIISINNAGAGLLLDGFTITGGIANGTDPDNTGAGIRIISASPVISNCRFEYNAATNGGAAYNTNAANPTFVDCVFLRNYALDAGGAVRNITASSPTLTGCSFIENKAAGFGGAVANLTNSSPLIDQCVFSYNWSNNGGAINNYDFCAPLIRQTVFRYNVTDNTGGAVRNENRSDTQLIGCGFYGNIAAHGAAMYSSLSNIVIANCVASGNMAIEYGGVLYNRDIISLGATNCTFVANTASIRGAAIYTIQNNPDIQPRIQNSILWDNTDPDLMPIYTVSGTPNVNYSCIEGGWSGGTGNIDSDPLFVDPNGTDGIIGTSDDDFRVFADSPCIDAGSNLLVGPDSADLDNDADVLERIPLDFNGAARFIDDLNAADAGVADPPTYAGIVDMGAVERRGPILVDAQAPGLEQDGQTWEKAYTHLQDGLAQAQKGDVLWIAQGTYRPDRSSDDPDGSGDRNAAFALVDGVILKGGYAGYTQANPNERDIQTYPVVLSGDLLDNDTPVTDPNLMQTDPSRADNAYHVITADAVGAPAELDGLTIRSGHAAGTPGYPESFGGAMYTTNTALVIADCSFQWNWAITGGALYNNGSSVAFSDCSFALNASEDKGGVMRNTTYTNATFADCNFIDNFAGGFGGVISSNDHSNSSLTRCIFENNRANSAACVNNFIACNSQFTDCAFTSNTASAYGGAVNNYEQSNAQFLRCSFSGNAAAFAGAIYNDNSEPGIIDCDFTGNTSTGNGGAVFSNASQLSVQTSTFTENQSGNLGGAIYNSSAGTLDLADCDFSTNTAVRGGAVYNDSIDAAVTDCSFLDNAAGGSGGAVFSTASQLSIERSTFNENQSGNFGGALYNSAAGTLDLADCDFSVNTAVQGGAVYGTNTPQTLTRCIFEDNTAGNNGGAVSNLSASLSIQDSRFWNNQSGLNGGALFNNAANQLDLIHCAFSSNDADNYGGGVYVQSATQANLVNCLMTYNGALSGGAVANFNSTALSLVHCTLSQNTASLVGTGIYNNSSSASIQNSICVNLIVPAESATVNYSCVPNWTGPGTGNITQAPAFADPDGPDSVPGSDDDNFRLTAASPCLDAADNSAVPAYLETDLDGLPRIVDADCSGTATADMGAYEFSYLSMGDFDGNCGINLLDFAELSQAWLSGAGDPLYDAKCDISTPADGTIDWQDLMILLENWMTGI